jgi:hypothetical protein
MTSTPIEFCDEPGEGGLELRGVMPHHWYRGLLPVGLHLVSVSNDAAAPRCGSILATKCARGIGL